MAEESKLVKNGCFSIRATLPDGKEEHFGSSPRTLEVIGGAIVITNIRTGAVTVLPPGSKAETGY